MFSSCSLRSTQSWSSRLTRSSRRWNGAFQRMSDRPCVVRTNGLSKFFPRGHYHTLYRLLQRNLPSLPGDRNGSNKLEALSNINVEIFKGEKVAVIGNNGAGKSTFLKVVAGLHRPSRGKLFVSGEV